MATITGLTSPSSNDKTGDMLQLKILADEGLDPIQAMKQGTDTKVCGDCPLRSVASGGSGGCYVVTAHAPLAVYRSTVDMPVTPWESIETPARFVKREKIPPIRLGEYGDPAFLPLDLLERLTDGRGHTGYTHQWRSVSEGYSEYLMASVETESQARVANAMGYRHFRVLPDHGAPLMENEVLCPYYSTDGKTQCADCGLCAGNRSKAKSVAVVAHGPLAPKESK